jgi:hypothetical protein
VDSHSTLLAATTRDGTAVLRFPRLTSKERTRTWGTGISGVFRKDRTGKIGDVSLEGNLDIRAGESVMDAKDFKIGQFPRGPHSASVLV